MSRTQGARCSSAVQRRGVTGVAVVLAALAAGATGTSAQTAEEEVLAVVQTLFDGMREKDEAKLRSVFHSSARLQSAGNPDQVTPIDQFIGGLLQNGAYLDEVTFDEQVWVDGDLAVAWTPYNFFAGDQFSHCGVDAFTMVKTEVGWKILQIVDTRVREGCDPDRRG